MRTEPTTITYAQLLDRLQQMPKELLGRKVCFEHRYKNLNHGTFEITEYKNVMELQDFNALDVFDGMPEVCHTETKRITPCQ